MGFAPYSPYRSDISIFICLRDSASVRPLYLSWIFFISGWRALIARADRADRNASGSTMRRTMIVIARMPHTHAVDSLVPRKTNRSWLTIHNQAIATLKG